MTIRTLHTVHRGDGFHWVGDGFYVTQLLPASPELQRLTDPFLLMDYNPVKEYPPTTTPRGVGVHPHRGFELRRVVVGRRQRRWRHDRSR